MQDVTWQMSGATYLGRLEHIIDVVGDSGFHGNEAEVQFLGAFRATRSAWVKSLRGTKSRSRSACIVEDWRGEEETDGEREAADWIIRYICQELSRRAPQRLSDAWEGPPRP